MSMKTLETVEQPSLKEKVDNFAVGDTVESGTVLIEVESEKATFEVEAGHAGTVAELLVGEGDEARVGDVVARIEP